MTKQTAQHLNLIGDSIILLAASAVATKVAGRPWHWLVFLGMSMGSTFVWMLGGRVLRHYDSWNGRGMAGDVVLTGTLLGIMLGVMATLRLVVPPYAAGSQIDRFILVSMPCILWLRSTTSWLRRREIPIRQLLVVGIGPLGRHTGLEIIDRNDHRRVLGHLRFADEAIHDRLPGEVLGTAADLENILKKHVVAEVFIAGNGDSQRVEMQQCIRVLERFGIPFALPAAGFRFGRARPEYERAVALGLISPLMVTVAVLIKFTSRGGILFKQERVGRHGRPFHMLKFRSMVVNAEELKAKLMAMNEQAGPVFKMKRDPRITPIGRFIRKFSIDELPQLINVLGGEMSLVGPRPPVPSEVAKYEAWQRRRLSVRPGLTCVWQVSGRNEISFEEWMYLDMQYIDHWSLAQDFQLILKTVPVVLTGRGAS